MRKEKKIEGLGLIKRQVIDDYQEPVILGNGIIEQISDVNIRVYNRYSKKRLEDLLSIFDKQ